MRRQTGRDLIKLLPESCLLFGGGGGLIKGGLIQLSLKGFQAKRWDGALFLREGQMVKELQSALSGLILAVARDGPNPTGSIIITAFIAARR